MATRKKRRARKKPRQTKLQMRLKRVASATKAKVKKAFEYKKTNHLQLLILSIQALTLVKLFQIDTFLKEGLTAIYMNGFVNDLMQNGMLQAILQALEVFIKDA